MGKDSLPQRDINLLKRDPIRSIAADSANRAMQQISVTINLDCSKEPMQAAGACREALLILSPPQELGRDAFSQAQSDKWPTSKVPYHRFLHNLLGGHHRHQLIPDIKGIKCPPHTSSCQANISNTAEILYFGDAGRGRKRDHIQPVSHMWQSGGESLGSGTFVIS